MKLTELTVRNPQVTLVLVTMLCALGVNAMVTIPRAEDPSFPVPMFTVVAVYPGATPRDIEKLVVDEIEKSLSEIDDVRRLRSRAQSGVGVTVVEFEAGVNVDNKHDAVRRQVEAIRSKLPAGIAKLEVEDFAISDIPVLELALVSDTAPYATLSHLASELNRRIEKVSGIKQAKTWGCPKQQARVSLDSTRLARLHVPPQQVLGALHAADARMPGGSVTQGGRTLDVDLGAGFDSIDAIRDTVVSGQGTANLRVRDVADVQLTDEDPSYTARFDGHRAVLITVSERDGQNIFTVRDAVLREVEAFAKALPADVTVQRGFDQTNNVAHRLGDLTRDFTIAIVLVLVTLLPLGLRASLIVMISIPLSLSLGVMMLRFAGYTINQLSIVGFVIALGLLVDDSIVVSENIARFRRLGWDRESASVDATRQIGVAIVGCTATLLLAFVPLLFLPGSPGDYIRSMPMAVVFTICASLLVSLTVIPFFASRVLRADGTHENWAYRLMSRSIERSYQPMLRVVLARPRATLLVAALLVAGTLALVPRIGFSLFPKAGTPQFLVKISTAEGASLEQTERAARYVEAVLSRSPHTRHMMTSIGRGNPRIYYNVAPSAEARHLAEVFVVHQGMSADATVAWLDELRAVFDDYAGAHIEVAEFMNGPAMEAPIAMRLIGNDLQALRTTAARVETLLAETDGARDVENPVRSERTDLKVVIDRQKAGLLGIPPGEAERTIRMALAGLPVGTLRQPNEDEREIVVTLPRAGRSTLDVLDSVYLASTAGAQVPLSQVARIELEPSASFIQHERRDRAVTVTAAVRTGFNTDRVTRAVLAKMRALPMPPGIRWVAAGEIEARQEAFGDLSTALLFAGFGILAILIIEFKTFRSMLIVATVIPLGVMGGLLALWLTGNTLSFVSFVGFIALIGIEVKNSILLVDFTNQLRSEGLSTDEAIARAGQTRFFPVLLTSLTAIGGLLPLAFEHSPLYSPLAVVVIGGLVTSTVLSRLVTPVAYKLFPPAVTRGQPRQEPMALSVAPR